MDDQNLAVGTPVTDEKAPGKAGAEEPPQPPPCLPGWVGKAGEENALLWRRAPCYTRSGVDVMGDLYYLAVPGGYLVRGLRGDHCFVPDPEHVIFDVFDTTPADPED